MKLVENYLSNFAAYLPEAIRQEVRDELSASIYAQLEDKAEQFGREVNESEQAEVLQQLGHPMRVAAAYLPNQQLVGAELFPMFKKVLQITLIFVFAIHLLMSLPYLANSPSIIGGAIQMAWGYLDTAVWVFGLITLIFFLLQSSKVNLDRLYAWSPFDLTEKADQAPVSRFETLFELAMEVLFIAWWNNLLSIPATAEAAYIIDSVSLSPQWAEVLWPVNILMGFVILINLHKLWVAGWNKINIGANILLNITFAAVIWQILSFDAYLSVATAGEEVILNSKTIRTMELSVGAILWIVLLTNIWEIFAGVRKLMSKK